MKIDKNYRGLLQGVNNKIIHKKKPLLSGFFCYDFNFSLAHTNKIKIEIINDDLKLLLNGIGATDITLAV